MILWIKYNKRPFPTYDKDTWIQPGDFELWIMGQNNRYLVTVNSQDRFHYEGNDFIVFKSKEELKIWLDLHNVKISRRIGFSECMYDFHGMKNDEFKDKFWVGYDLKTDFDVLH